MVDNHDIKSGILMMFHKEWARSCMRCHGRKQESLNGMPGFLAHVIGRGIHVDIYKMRKSAADEKILSYNDVVLRRSDLDILSCPYFLNDRIIEFYFSYLPSCYPSKEILLVSPSIAFWIANWPDIESLKDFVEPLNLSSKKLSSPALNIYLKVSSIATPISMAGLKIELIIPVTIVKAICRWYESKSEPKDEDGLWFSTMNEQVNPSVVAEMRNEILGLVKSLMAMK
ncbi:unnamed protein product [Camellia sinensis]